MSNVMRALRIVGLFLVLTLGTSLSAAAQAGGRSIAWERFDVDLTIQSDGSVNVVETQAIHFNGTYQQGYRLVPLDRTTGASGIAVAELANDQSIPYRSGSGQRPNTYSSTVSSGGLQIDWWFPPTTNATRTFVLRYTVAGALRLYDAGDQLQWRAIYADRDGSIASSTITIHLASDVDAADLRSAWYRYSGTGAIGALPPVANGTQLDTRTVQFGPGPLGSGQGAEVRVQFPHGAINASPPAWQAGADRADWLQQSAGPIGNFLALLLTLGILAGGGIFLFFAWYSNGRDPAVGSVPLRLESPPSTIPAPVAGALLHEGGTQQEAVATLVDLADRGVVRIAEEANENMRLTLVMPLPEAELRGYERVLLTAIFGSAPKPQAEVLLSTVKARFQASIPVIDGELTEAVTREGWFARNPAVTRRRWRTVGVLALIGGAILAFGAGMALTFAVQLAALPGVALVLFGGVMLWVAGRMPRKTPAGALEAAKWRAFAAHLRDVVHGGGGALPAHFLPYATAFGIDRAFLEHMERVGTAPPAWYGPVFIPGPWSYGGFGGPPHRDGPGGGVAAPPAPNPQGWSDVLAALLNAASEAMTHGGGSGGWSGGGFGGGGGGGGGSGGFR